MWGCVGVVLGCDDGARGGSRSQIPAVLWEAGIGDVFVGRPGKKYQKRLRSV